MTAGRRAALLATLFVVATMSVGTVHEFLLGRAALENCDAAIAHGDLPRAIDAARDAAQTTAPASPYPALGYARLANLARAAESRGDDATAAAAWRSVRAAALSTRTLFSSGGHAAEANDGLTRVAAHAHGGMQPANATLFRSTLEGALAEDDTPSGGLFLLLGSGAIAFFGGVFLMLRLPKDASLRDIGLRASIAAGGFALALAACLES